MNDPERLVDAELPICSIHECENVAAVVIDEDFLCAEHATEALNDRLR